MTEATHPPIANKVVLIDFDGTLFPWGHKFNTEAQPLPGAVTFMKQLKKDGYTIGIFTSRLSKKWLAAENEDKRKHRFFVKNMCKLHGIPVDFITGEKMPAEFYVDDKAAPFEGDWDVTKKWYETRTS